MPFLTKPLTKKEEREFYEKQVPKSGFRVQHRQKPASRPKSGSTPKENGNG